MKHTKSILAALAALATFAPGISHGQNAGDPAQEEKAAQKLQIVFVPQKTLLENIPSGKLKENTFYWCNGTDDAQMSPTGTSEDGKTFLRIDGKFGEIKTDINGLAPWGKLVTDSTTTLVRAFNVPANAKFAVVTMNQRHLYDPWKDPANSRVDSPSGQYSLCKDGQAVTRPMTINQTSDWKTMQTKIPVFSGTQQIVVGIKARAHKIVDIALMDVQFFEKEPTLVE